MVKVEEEFTKEYLSKLDKEMGFMPITLDALFKFIVLRNVDFFKEFLIKVLKLDISSDDSYILFLAKELIKGKINENGKVVDINVKLVDDLLIDVEINRSIYKASKRMI